MAAGGVAASASVPVIWDFLGYQFEAGPLVVSICCTLITRLIISLQHVDRRRWLLDVSVTALSILVSALWVQANHLTLLPAGLSGIGFGALGVGIVGLAKSQITVALKAALQTLLRGLAAPQAHADDKDGDLLRELDKHD